VACCADDERRVLWFFRWRGRWNWKDISERFVASLLSGVAAGFMFWALVTVLGGGVQP